MGVPRQFFAYLLECADGSYYVGHTDDFQRRLAEHQEGGRGGYTAVRRPMTLLWCAAFATRDEAKAVESQVKRWSRAKKKVLSCGDVDALRLAAKKKWPRRPE